MAKTYEHYGEKALHFERDEELIQLASQGRQRRGANIWRKDKTNGR